MPELKIEHILMLAIAAFVLYHFMSISSYIDGFSIGGKRHHSGRGRHGKSDEKIKLEKEIIKLEREILQLNNRSCNVGDSVKCHDSITYCAGNQCCPDGSICPSADDSFTGCPKSKNIDCTEPFNRNTCETKFYDLCYPDDNNDKGFKNRTECKKCMNTHKKKLQKNTCNQKFIDNYCNIIVCDSDDDCKNDVRGKECTDIGKSWRECR